MSQTVEEAKYRCKTLSVASVERLSQFAAAQPSAALRAMEGILRTLRCTPLVFACAKKKSTHGIPDGLPSVAYDEDLKEFRSSASVLGDKDFLARLSSKAGRLFLRPGRPKNSVIKL